MRGGHSGCEIHENRGNALVSLVDFLASSGLVLGVYELKSGTAHNVIPSKAEAIVELSDSESFRRLAEKYVDDMRGQFDCPEVTFSCEGLSGNSHLRIIPGWNDIFSDILRFHSGVYAMSEKISGLVQTSMNLGVIDIDSSYAKIVYLARSSVNPELDDLVESVQSYYSEKGYDIETDRGYPGWQDDPNSELLAIAREEIRTVLGKEPKVVALHAGLECGAMVTGLGA